MNKTLNSEDAVLFPFLNNGITIITEQITVPKSAQDGKYNLPVVNYKQLFYCINFFL